MIQCILAAPYIKRITVSQKGAASVAPHQVDNNLRVVRAQVCQVARLPEMDFDRCKFILEIQLFNARLYHQFFQLLQQILIQASSKISKIDLCFFHLVSSFVFTSIQIMDGHSIATYSIDKSFLL